MSISNPSEYVTNLSAAEARLLRQMIAALRDIQHGSIVLTVHNGRLVEIQRTERTRVVNSNDHD